MHIVSLRTQEIEKREWKLPDSDSGIDTSRHGQLTGDGEKRKASAI
jgi:hypothetical protein